MGTVKTSAELGRETITKSALSPDGGEGDAKRIFGTKALIAALVLVA